MPEGDFRVSNAGGMWIRKNPVVSKETEKVLLPKGHLVTISDYHTSHQRRLEWFQRTQRILCQTIAVAKQLSKPVTPRMADAVPHLESADMPTPPASEMENEKWWIQV